MLNNFDKVPDSIVLNIEGDSKMIVQSDPSISMSDSFNRESSLKYYVGSNYLCSTPKSLHLHHALIVLLIY